MKVQVTIIVVTLMTASVTLLSFTPKFYYVMGKSVSGELSCMGTGTVFFPFVVPSVCLSIHRTLMLHP